MSATTSNFAGPYHRSENVTSLLLDIYLIPQNPKGTIRSFFSEHDILLELANLAVQLNAYIRQHSINNDRSEKISLDLDGAITNNSCYRWISGGDGPVFGIHCSRCDSLDPPDDAGVNSTNKQSDVFMIPHLRTICRYGVCVNDEWCLIGLILDFLDDHTFITELRNRMHCEVAIECWDMDDGQIILIEGAESIPQWMDDIGPNHCSHRCWIRPSGGTHTAVQSFRPNRNWVLQLIRPKDIRQAKPLQLGEALQLLSNQQCINDNSVVEYAPKSMEKAITKRIQKSRTEQLPCHRAAVVLPESVVRLFRRRPDLIATACQMFVEHIQDPIRVKKLDDYLFGVCEHWIWTTMPLSRTAYAMIRTAVSPPEWINEGSIAPTVLATSSLEVKRYQRQCAVEATPHLRYGLQLGVRLLAGLHHCIHGQIQSNVNIVADTHSNCAMSNAERRVLLHWSRVAKQCDMNSGSVPDTCDWITDAWYAGPNLTKFDLTSILQCPVFAPEIRSTITPLSFPDAKLSEQIRKELLRPRNSMKLSSNPPHHTQVDDEDWMWILSTSKDALVLDLAPIQSKPKSSSSTASNIPPEQAAVTPLDEMLAGVESFVDGTSTIHGVDTKKKPIGDEGTPTTINPTLFMNILHTALKSSSAEELSDELEVMISTKPRINDPFFAEEDYLLMDPSSDHESDDNSDDHSGVDAHTMKIEDIMKVMDAELRDGASTSRAWDEGISTNFDDDIARNAHVLSNLLKSIDASGGGSGPVRNILQEMGVDDPLLMNVDNGSENENDGANRCEGVNESIVVEKQARIV